MSLLYLTSGDAYLEGRRLDITVTDASDATVDLTGMTLTFMVKHQGDVLITKVTPSDIEIASPQTGTTKGVAYIALEEADTADLKGRYVWELEAVDSVGAVTLASGALYIKSDLITGGS